MKIAMPVQGGKLSQHFGHSEQFSLFEIEDQSIRGREDVTPPPHEPGLLPRWLKEHGVTLVIAGGMGHRAQMIFEQAGIQVPEGPTSWVEWAAVTRQVAAATGTPYAMVMDRTGHRLAGPAISQGAQYLDADGKPAIDDPGMRYMMQLMIDWHADGTMNPDVWIGSAGSYAAGNEFFVNAQVVLYMSGS